ncbi:MAG: formyltransferase family protein [Nitrospinales bacterium]
MKVVILTSSRNTTASRCLSILCHNPNVKVERVILAHGLHPNRKRLLKKKIIKVLRIGLLGALNGIRMRAWYADGAETEDISTLCEKFNVPFYESDYINCDKTRALFNESDADLGLSLGNGYIPKSVFSIPRNGMINIHGEILPDYQNAQSVIWPIYNGEVYTGLTIHQIDNKIDTGLILYQERYPIKFHRDLEETVRQTIQITSQKAPEAISYVCENYEYLYKTGKVQENGKSYTTPSFWQFLHMIKQNRRLYMMSNSLSR